MPEIGEVARIVHYLKKHLVGKCIANVLVQEDDIVYGKVGTSAGAFQKAMKGKTILDARQQGKYFYLVCNSPPHPVMHLGMTGWMRFNNDDSSYYKPEKEKPEDKEWPPRFWKFILQTEGKEKGEIAFVDARRLARIRLIEADGEDLRNQSPLKENGPDPVIDKDILTYDWLRDKMRSKKVPIKALLLNQANISGVGNWVADEVLYQARIHPEQYSNTFSDDQIKTLHDSLINVCTIAVDTMSEQSKFPKEWIMKYRWNKGKKDSNVLPNGEKITHITVGGRTSAVVLSRQKKTGAVAGDAKEAEDDEEEVGGKGKEPKSKSRGSRKRKSDGVEDEQAEEPEARPKRAKKAKQEVEQDEAQAQTQRSANVKEPASRPAKATRSRKVKKELEQDEAQADSAEEVEKPASKPTKTAKIQKANTKSDDQPSSRRRSARLSG